MRAKWWIAHNCYRQATWIISQLQRSISGTISSGRRMWPGEFGLACVTHARTQAPDQPRDDRQYDEWQIEVMRYLMYIYSTYGREKRICLSGWKLHLVWKISELSANEVDSMPYSNCMCTVGRSRAIYHRRWCKYIDDLNRQFFHLSRRAVAEVNCCRLYTIIYSKEFFFEVT